MTSSTEQIKSQIKSFLLRCNEDGGMSITDLQKLANSIGVKNSERIHTEIALVHEIQNSLQHRACFKIQHISLCDDTECQWRKECQKLIAVWCR